RERERIEQLEEEYEGGRQQLLGEAFAMELGHQRHERRAALRGKSVQRGDRASRKLDVGVEQQRERPAREVETLLERPRLPGPTGRQRAAREHADGECVR